MGLLILVVLSSPVPSTYPPARLYSRSCTHSHLCAPKVVICTNTQLLMTIRIAFYGVCNSQVPPVEARSTLYSRSCTPTHLCAPEVVIFRHAACYHECQVHLAVYVRCLRSKGFADSSSYHWYNYCLSWAAVAKFYRASSYEVHSPPGALGPQTAADLPWHHHLPLKPRLRG